MGRMIMQAVVMASCILTFIGISGILFDIKGCVWGALPCLASGIGHQLS
jgi:hypothetical protein